MEASARYTVATPGISPEECESRKCCFSDTIPQVPLVLLPISVEGNVGEHRQLPRHRQFSGGTGSRVVGGPQLGCDARCQVPKPRGWSVQEKPYSCGASPIVNHLRSQFENVLNNLQLFKK